MPLFADSRSSARASRRRPTLAAMALALLAAVACQSACGQAPTIVAAPEQAKPEFEVASIRESRSEKPPTSNFPLNPGPQYGETGGELIARNTVLLQFVVFAYKPSSSQIQTLRQGMPEWTRGARYDITAKAAGPATKDQMRAMMRSLLEDRFGMRVHRESRESIVFALTLAKPGKLGPKLVLHPADDPNCLKVPLPQTAAGGYPHQCGTGAMIAASGPGLSAMGGQKVTMDEFVLSLTNLYNGIERPVVNRTGLTGAYDYTLEWAVESGDPAEIRGDAGPNFSEALGEQLGLKLVPDKAPVQVLLVDKVERPTPN